MAPMNGIELHKKNKGYIDAQNGIFLSRLECSAKRDNYQKIPVKLLGIYEVSDNNN
jgi:hypothetical protein